MGTAKGVRKRLGGKVIFPWDRSVAIKLRGHNIYVASKVLPEITFPKSNGGNLFAKGECVQ